MPGALDGLLVVSVEQAVAAPYCSARLADAGARVIKIERPEGDFARGYDSYVHGLSSYFVWLNRGQAVDRPRLQEAGGFGPPPSADRQGGRVDPEPAPGAAERAGFGSTAMRATHKKLITVDVSGYGDHWPLQEPPRLRPAGEAESGLASITGTEHAPGRVGISATDIGTGMYAPRRRARGADRAPEERRGAAPSRSRCFPRWPSGWLCRCSPWTTRPTNGRGSASPHPFIAPYGVYPSADGVPVLISIQNDREFERLCHNVIDRPGLEKDARYATGIARNERRDDTNAIVHESFARLAFAELAARLDAAQIAWARVSDIAALSKHPQLRRTSFGSPKGDISIPALAASYNGEPERLGDVPTLGQHTDQVRREFAAP